MSKLSNVWVYCDVDSRLPEVIAGGLQLGEKVSAFVFGDAAKAFSYGATAAYNLGDKGSNIVENYAESMAQVIAQGAKPTLVLLPATKRGKALAAKLGVLLDAGIITDASSIVYDGSVKAKHMVFGGLAQGEEKITSQVAIVTVANGVFEAAPADASKSGETVAVTYVEPAAAIKCLERKPKAGGGVDLNKAKRVVGVGRGFAAKDDLKLAEALCAALGAEMGCSRPIAESEKWMERERYIGVSNMIIKPDVYVAVGISGQVQHMVGVNEAKVIVAINKDKNAPIFQNADYGIVGDLNKVLPALTAALKG